MATSLSTVKSMPSQLFGVFAFPAIDRLGYLRVSWVSDPKAVRAIIETCLVIDPNFSLADIPLTNLNRVDNYFSNWLEASDQRLETVADLLYAGFIAEDFPPDVQVSWQNLFRYMGANVIRDLWTKFPQERQTDDVLYRLISAVEQFGNRYASQKVLASFDLNYNQNLLSGIQAWIYRYIKNNLSAYIRDRKIIQFQGISDLAIVKNSSTVSMRSVLGNYRSSLEINDILLCQIFQQFISMSADIYVADLNQEDSDQYWEEINQEYRSQTNSKIQLTAAQLRSRVQNIGRLIRNYTYSHHPESLVSSYPPSSEKDEQIDPIDIIANRPINRPDTKLEWNEWTEYHARLNPIVDNFTSGLDLLNQQIFQLYYSKGLNQVEIARLIDKDQSLISRRLKSNHKILLAAIHQELISASEIAPEINDVSIAAISRFLRVYFQQKFTEQSSIVDRC